MKLAITCIPISDITIHRVEIRGDRIWSCRILTYHCSPWIFYSLVDRKFGICCPKELIHTFSKC